MGINEALDNLYVCATNAKSETLEEGYYEKCYDRVIEELNQKDKAETDLYEANNCISDLLDIVKQKDKIIQEMIKVIIDSGICDYFIKQHCVHYAGENKKLCDECILEYFEERCNNAKD